MQQICLQNKTQQEHIKTTYSLGQGIPLLRSLQLQEVNHITKSGWAKNFSKSIAVKLNKFKEHQRVSFQCMTWVTTSVTAIWNKTSIITWARKIWIFKKSVAHSQHPWWIVSYIQSKISTLKRPQLRVVINQGKTSSKLTSPSRFSTTLENCKTAKMK